jgi:uncharacterized membrane protein YphA (DoxX/SURF4 family)
MPLDFLLRYVPGVFLVVAGSSKVAGGRSFQQGLGDFGIFSLVARRWIARVLPLVEIAVGASLLVGVSTTAALLAAAGLLVFFTVLLVRARQRRPGLRCHCLGGMVSGESSTLGISRNLALIACLGIATARPLDAGGLSSGEHALLLVAACELVLSYALLASLHGLRGAFGVVGRAPAAAKDPGAEAAT